MKDNQRIQILYLQAHGLPMVTRIKQWTCLILLDLYQARKDKQRIKI